jgi:sterol desaturase/sphingolipid hydroxylase (fatty acid hydroxylase superfamily)
MWYLCIILIPVATTALLFVPLELVLPSRTIHRRSMRSRVTDFLHATLGVALARIGTALLLALLLPEQPPHRAADVLPLWAQVIAILLICDFMIWVVHRMFHAVPALWRLHRIHHNSLQLDWLATYRVHPIEQSIFVVGTVLPVALLGFSPTAYAIYISFYNVHSHLLHAKTRLSFGPFNVLFTEPRIHHWHHADQPEAYDSNFGSELVIWDKMFGTAYRPDADLPVRYGVESPPRESFAAHMLAPFRSRTADQALRQSQ